jgi:hypothetical protein
MTLLFFKTLYQIYDVSAVQRRQKQYALKLWKVASSRTQVQKMEIQPTICPQKRLGNQ